MGTSFARDIAPMLAPYRENMLWRFDLADYDGVKSNAELIYGQIDPSTGSMPPAPLPPIEPSGIATFKQWMAEACPP